SGGSSSPHSSTIFTDVPGRGRPMGSGSGSGEAGSRRYEVQTLVSVGPYQLTSRASGSAARSARTHLAANGSPAKTTVRRAGTALAVSPPRSSRRTRSDGTAYNTVTPYWPSAAVSVAGKRRLSGGRTIVAAPDN